jgi:hypothetical protein
MRARVSGLTVSGPPHVLAAIEAARGDLIEAGGVDTLSLTDAEEFSVSVVLADEG